jgi:CheY-like chemotaxis protein
MKRRLLLIDDAPDNLDFLSVFLADTYDVFCYTSGEEALHALPGIKPELLLLDVRMLPVNGVDFLKTVRGMTGFAHIPAVAVTALAYETHRQTIVEAGFQTVVTKPITDLRQFQHLIEEMLRSSEDPIDPALADDGTCASVHRTRPIDGPSKAVALSLPWHRQTL